MSSLLISLTDFDGFKNITSNINTVKRLDPYIREAQEFDLRRFLGEELYIDLIDDLDASPSLETYGDLVTGSTYTKDGITYQHDGLKPVLVYFTYARYLENAGVASTNFGVVQKKNEFSDPIDEKRTGRLISQARSGAIVYQARVERYLNDHSTDFPLWNCSAGKIRTGLPRIVAVGKTKRSCRECGYDKKYCECNNLY